MNLPDNMINHAVYNTIIRQKFPGGAEILSICERLHQAQYGRINKDPMLQDLFDTAILARDKMINAIKESTDGTFVKL
jgi:hypothetical protein